MGFDEYHGLPEGFLQVESREIHRICPRPSLIHIPGVRQPALFVSILLHGNEDAGLLAIQELFRQLHGKRLPRAMKLFVGNVEACRLGVRFTSRQVDFNRAWPGTDLPPSDTQQMLAQVLRRVTEEPLFASIDIHNNTGRNPLYSCICSLDNKHIRLATLFSDKIVHFTRPKGVQTQAFSDVCPSVTIECGQIGDIQGAHAAASFLRRCLESEQIGSATHAQADVYESVARVLLKPEGNVGFESDNEFMIREDIDLLNFRSLQPGETIGLLSTALSRCLQVIDAAGQDVTDSYLDVHAGSVRFKQAVMPAMLTRDIRVMRQDCLGYLMQVIPLHIQTD